MSVVLVVLAALTGLVVLLLAVPVGVSFRFQGLEPLEGGIAIRWLFGLVRFRIRVPGPPESRPPKPEAEPEAAKVSKPKKRGRRRNALAVLGQAAFRRRLYRLVGDVLRAAHLHQLAVRVRLGLGDPADTGRLWALLGPLAAVGRDLRHADVRIEPEFVEPVLDFEAQGRLLLVPLQLLALAVAFALSPPAIRAWRTLWAGHA